jgi:hypothetical protein
MSSYLSSDINTAMNVSPLILYTTAIALSGCSAGLSTGNTPAREAAAFRQEQLALVSEILDKLSTADQIDLIVLNGDQIRDSTPTKDSEQFHGWKIRQPGRRLSDGQRNEVVGLFRRELPSRRGNRASCFEPGFAVEALLRNGKTIDLVFCFGCGGMLYFDETGVEREPWLPIIDELGIVFRKITEEKVHSNDLPAVDQPHEAAIVN